YFLFHVSFDSWKLRYIGNADRKGHARAASARFHYVETIELHPFLGPGTQRGPHLRRQLEAKTRISVPRRGEGSHDGAGSRSGCATSQEPRVRCPRGLPAPHRSLSFACKSRRGRTARGQRGGSMWQRRGADSPSVARRSFGTAESLSRKQP